MSPTWSLLSDTAPSQAQDLKQHLLHLKGLPALLQCNIYSHRRKILACLESRAACRVLASRRREKEKEKEKERGTHTSLTISLTATTRGRGGRSADGSHWDQM